MIYKIEYVGSRLGQLTLYDAGPTLKQHRVDALCVLGSETFAHLEPVDYLHFLLFPSENLEN